MSASIVIDSNWRWTDVSMNCILFCAVFWSHSHSLLYCLLRITTKSKKVDGTNCYTGNDWNETFCPKSEEGAKSCAENCALEGADTEYEHVYGIRTDGDKLNLTYVTSYDDDYSNGTNAGSRVYVMDGEDSYKMFYLKNRELSLDVDYSSLGCGLNGAVYFVEMDQDGGKSKYPGNEAGAKYGTGYCDAQCPHDIKYMNGEGESSDSFSHC